MGTFPREPTPDEATQNTMRTMFAVTALLACSVAVADPQWGYNYNPFGYPGSQFPGYTGPLGGYPYQYQLPYVQYQPLQPVPQAVPLLPVLPKSTSSDIPQPVEDTLEVKAAKERFAQEYEKAALAAKLNPDTGVHRRRRDLGISMAAVPTSGLYPAGLGPIYSVSHHAYGLQTPSYFLGLRGPQYQRY